MTLATEVRYTASLEADKTWTRCKWLLRLLWFGGERALLRVTAHYSSELGVMVQGDGTDPFWLVDEALSAESAMNVLRHRNVKAYTLAAWDVEPCKDSRERNHECSRECRQWFNSRGTGPADLMNLDSITAHRYYAGALECVHWLLSDDENGERVKRISELLDT